MRRAALRSDSACVRWHVLRGMRTSAHGRGQVTSVVLMRRGARPAQDGSSHTSAVAVKNCPGVLWGASLAQHGSYTRARPTRCLLPSLRPSPGVGLSPDPCPDPRGSARGPAAALPARLAAAAERGLVAREEGRRVRGGWALSRAGPIRVTGPVACLAALR